MELTDILLTLILAVLVRGQVINSEWMKSKQRDLRRKKYAWRKRGE